MTEIWHAGHICWQAEIFFIRHLWDNWIYSGCSMNVELYGTVSMTSGEHWEALGCSAPDIRCKVFFQSRPTCFWIQSRSYRPFFIDPTVVTHPNVHNSITANQVWWSKMSVLYFVSDFWKTKCLSTAWSGRNTFGGPECSNKRFQRVSYGLRDKSKPL